MTDNPKKELTCGFTCTRRQSPFKRSLVFTKQLGLRIQPNLHADKSILNNYRLEYFTGNKYLNNISFVKQEIQYRTSCELTHTLKQAPNFTTTGHFLYLLVLVFHCIVLEHKTSTFNHVNNCYRQKIISNYEKLLILAVRSCNYVTIRRYLNHQKLEKLRLRF